ncbi:MAG: 2-isopropylmalate synthase [Spirochaetaceae bacterium]|nr:2-isopropylmalate synthase [Spirochaetaceae bacterium]
MIEIGSERIQVFDTTLRDGEQAAGNRLTPRQKLEIAHQLNTLNVDVIEAGFPASSPGDLEAVKLIARKIRGPVITGLARAVEKDIDQLWEAVCKAEQNRIHIVLGSSDKHISGKFSSSREAVLQRGVDAVRYAKKLTDQVEYSTEDASRSDFDYLCRVVEEVIKAGATVVNIPDTVGWAVPEEFGPLIHRIKERVPLTDKVILSVHCHNDLGFATSNTMAAIKNGAQQVEVTINGIGERAGNASLEEVVMLLDRRGDYYKRGTNIDISEILTTSKMVSEMMALPVQANKAIVGKNAFAHSSGIHQDGILKETGTYEIIPPKLLGLDKHQIILTARSGKHALKHTYNELGIQLNDRELKQLYPHFLNFADSHKNISHSDLKKLYKSAVDR